MPGKQLEIQFQPVRLGTHDPGEAPARTREKGPESPRDEEGDGVKVRWKIRLAGRFPSVARKTL